MWEVSTSLMLKCLNNANFLSWLIICGNLRRSRATNKIRWVTILKRISESHLFIIHVIKEQIMLETRRATHYSWIFLLIPGATSVVYHNTSRVEGLDRSYQHVALGFAGRTHLLLHSWAVIVFQPYIFRALFKILWKVLKQGSFLILSKQLVCEETVEGFETRWVVAECLLVKLYRIDLIFLCLVWTSK